jgi:hypothetical protein
MKYAIIKVINGNYSIHAEGITSLASAKSQYHGLCQVLWNAPDVITGCVAIVNENLEVVTEYMQRYQEFIQHNAPNTENE